MNLIAAHLLLFFGSLFAYQSSLLPEKGVPYLKNFTPAEYDHKGKIWNIDSAPNGLVYMASNAGLLEFDGETWNSFRGSDGITRSVITVNDSLIYTGSDLDFGVWKKNEYQEFEYNSLYPFKEDLTQISEEFWNVHYLNENVFFISTSNIYVYSDGNLTKIAAPNEIQKSFHINGSIYFIDEEGLFQLKDLSPQKISELTTNEVPEVVGVYNDGDELVFVTQNSGLFLLRDGLLEPIENELSKDLKEANVFSFEVIHDTHLAFGTILKGVFITDLNGNIIHQINKNKGLQNNTVLSLHHDKFGHLWMGMDYGVSFLDLSNNYTFFYDYRGDFGTGYSAVLRDDVFFLGTNQGLYKTGWEDLNNYRSEFDNFEIIEGSEGQVWSLHTIEDQIWVAHDRGLFVLEDRQLKRIGEQRGIWTIQPYKEYLLVGTYNGISIFRKEDGLWTYWKQMELILGSCNQIVVEEDDSIWINIPNFGVIKAELDKDLVPTEREIFLSKKFGSNEHYLNKNNGNIQVLTNSHQFEFSGQDNEFNQSVRNELNTEVEDQLQGTTEPVRLDQNYEFYPIYNGFAIKDVGLELAGRHSEYTLIFRRVEAFNNDESIQVYSGAEIPHRSNNVRIVSIVPNQSDVRYQYKSKDSNEWSDWSDSGIIDLVGLGHGDHEISVRAEVDGQTTSEASIIFGIQPPWYFTWYAITAYIFLGYLLIWAVYFVQGAKLKKQKKSLLIDQRQSLHKQEQQYRQKLKYAEEAKLKAEYDQIKEQLKSKTIELATKARENDEKNRILESLNEKLKRIEDNPENLIRRVSEIQEVIESHINSDDNTFEIQIDELHKDFYAVLREEFSDLTRYDLRLCAYIKLGFDSKEISDLLNIKPSSVYISRSRLRKKLNIESDEDLHGYLSTL